MASAISQGTIGSHDSNGSLSRPHAHLFDNPIVRGGGIIDVDTRIGAFDIKDRSIFLFAPIKHNPDLAVSGIRELLYSFYKKTLRGFFPPLCAVTANEHSCM
jgi:hypothetical protein